MIDDPCVASIPIHDEWIDEAGAQLKAFHSRRLVVRFMRRHGLHPERFETDTAAVGEIKRCIRAADHPLRLDDLAAYLDELKASGRQVVFLWRLKEGEEAYLARLSELEHVRETLGQDADRLNDGRLVWESEKPALASEPEKPVLAEVRHTGKEGVLRFKWIVSRRYWIEKKAGPGVPPVTLFKTQRAVTYFKLDLKSGDGELRIHSLPYGAKGLPELRKELETYRAEVERYVELSRFSPILIEPVAHGWLIEPLGGLEITNWSVVRPAGEYLNGGGGKAGNTSKLKLIVNEYFARDVMLRWECRQRVIKRPLFFSLDGHADCIDFNGLADASRVNFLLDRIRQHGRPDLHMRELRELAGKYPEHVRILASLDHLFFTRKESEVSVEDVAKDVWYDPGTIQRVFALAAQEFPKVFSLQGDVLTMKNRLRVREGGLVETLERYAKKRGYPRVQSLVKPAMGVLTLIALQLYDFLFSWIWETFFESLTGLPYDAVDLGLLLLLGVLHLVVTFGGATLRGWGLRLIRLWLMGLRWLKPLRAVPDDATLEGTCEAMFRKWKASPARASVRRGLAIPRALIRAHRPLHPAAP